ncbi:MAG: hypothetical protein IKE70_05170 [Bacilli bacterium]|nr:hypothetical protein [Bacilli bacterium]
MEKDDRKIVNKDKIVLDGVDLNPEKDEELNRGDTYSTVSLDFLNIGGIITDQEYEVTCEINEKNKKNL